MHERKKTAVHGTLQMILMAWKFNSKELLLKTFNSRINIIEMRAVLNTVKTDKKWAPKILRHKSKIARLRPAAIAI